MLKKDAQAPLPGTAAGASAARSFIPVYEPLIGELEKAYVNDCLDTGWISSIGKYVERFEKEVATLSGVPHAVAVSNGTVALHLAHHCLACSRAMRSLSRPSPISPPSTRSLRQARFPSSWIRAPTTG